MLSAGHGGRLPSRQRLSASLDVHDASGSAGSIRAVAHTAEPRGCAAAVRLRRPKTHRLAPVRLPLLTAEPVDSSFFQAAPQRLRDTFEIARPAADVWAQLTGDSALAWCRILTDVSWTSPRPFGVGTTRTVRGLGGASVIEERFFVWEEGRRQSFYAVATSVPMFRRFAEDLELEPTGDAACRLTWTIAIESRPWSRPAAALNGLIFGTLFADTRRHYGAA